MRQEFEPGALAEDLRLPPKPSKYLCTVVLQLYRLYTPEPLDRPTLEPSTPEA